MAKLINKTIISQIKLIEAEHVSKNLGEMEQTKNREKITT